jgi:hypothetical protein
MFLSTLLTAIVVAWLTAQFAARRFYRERWWDKKYDAYTSLLNSLHTILRAINAPLVLYDDGLLDRNSEEIKKAQKSNDDYLAARAELRRLSDIGEFILSSAALDEINQLSEIFTRPNKESSEILEKAVRTCLENIRQHARDDLNPSGLRRLNEWGFPNSSSTRRL